MASAKPKHSPKNTAATTAIETVKRSHRIGKEAVAAAPEGSRTDGATVKRLADREGFGVIVGFTP